MEQAPVTPDAPAAPSPAPVDTSTYLESLDSQGRDEFFSGTPASRIDKLAKSAAPAESAPATPVDQDASTEAKPTADSEPAKPAKTKGLEARSTQVDQQIADLKRKLEIKQELERQLSQQTRPPDAKPAESSPAETKKSWEQYRNLPDAPKQTDFESYDDYLDARAEFIADKRYEAREQAAVAAAKQHQEVQQYQTRVQTAQKRVQAYREKHPEAMPNETLASIPPISQLPPGAPVRPEHFVMEQVIDSDLPGELLMHFTEHPDVFESLLTMRPEAIVRHIGKLEAALSSPAEPQPERTTPSPKVIPDVQDVPTSITSRSSSTASDQDTALRSKDFAAYERDFLARAKARIGA